MAPEHAVDNPSKRLWSPRQTMDALWSSFQSRRFAPISSILPERSEAAAFEGTSLRNSLPCTYEQAKTACAQRVVQIVNDCRRDQQRFTDVDFDIAQGKIMNTDDHDCLYGLMPRLEPAGRDKFYRPKSVHRVGWIFDKPQLGKNLPRTRLPDVTSPMPTTTPGHCPGHEASSFHRNTITAFTLCTFLYPGVLAIILRLWILSRLGLVVFYFMIPCRAFITPWLRLTLTSGSTQFSSSDVVQGDLGDCWFLSAIAAVCDRVDLLENLCVAWDRDCGVYGFVFYRDGEWIYTVVDDYLFLTEGDWVPTTVALANDAVQQSEEHKSRYQTGSSALYFARSKDQNQYWLPLLEKAYAKVHGDYDALAGGDIGEAAEDLTGGVSKVLLLDSYLDKENLWQDLTHHNGEYVFGLGTDRAPTSVQGLSPTHAYTIIRAYNCRLCYGSTRLVLIRNPWGQQDAAGRGNWQGSWSNGSKEWTWWRMLLLRRQFLDDGTF